jgi:hypothetical protein
VYYKRDIKACEGPWIYMTDRPVLID